MELQKKLDRILKRVEKPGRYIGGEVNSAKKNLISVKERMAFAFPDLYEIGMSYLGMQILYNAVNKEEVMYCERVFAPSPDMEKLEGFSRRNTLCGTYERGKPPFIYAGDKDTT